ncbi:hypothetical protein NM208_g6799 [Fusarium decemcellulare]|uniref:Uncharacterized protein n=1 Tax=Fusarium decemcellulare TaxID=57161 RepID=A0ACC1SBQ0_9HYPO|nr:hypothetical protein NM208_g6799 [Fusarium decemcellulare]
MTRTEAYPPKGQILYDVVIILSLIALVPVMVWIILSAPKIPHDTSFVVAGVTFLATIYTSVVKGRVQHGLMRGLEKDLRTIGNYPEPEHPPQPPTKRPFWERLKEKMKYEPSPKELLDTRWRGVLVIDSLGEKILYNKKFFFVYLPSALLTTAIVTVFTPNSGRRGTTYYPVVPGPQYSYNFTGDSDECAGQGEGSVTGAYSWDLGNNITFFARYRGDCPPSRITSHVSNINSKSPDKYAYVDAGVAVERTAMGASAQLYRGTVFQKLEEEHGRFLRSTSQCVPVMTSNPVTCKTGGGKLRVGDDPKSLFYVPDKIPGLDIGVRLVEFAARDFTKDSGMVNYLWVDDRNNTVGPGVMVWSAYNDPKGKTLFAKDLARTINDPDKKAGTGGSTTYVVTCEINPLESFEYRWVTLNLQASETTNNTGMAYSRRLSGGGTCTPKKQTVGNLHFVAATASQYKMVMESYGLDGYFSTVHTVAGEDRGPPYAFSNSKNALEDTLGVISALGVANMDLWDDPVVADAVGEGGEAEAIIEIKRLGGNRLVLIALFPPVFSTIILGCLFVMSFKQKRQPGGGVVDGERLELYAAESIRELITLGKPAVELPLVEHRPLLK